MRKDLFLYYTSLLRKALDATDLVPKFWDKVKVFAFYYFMSMDILAVGLVLGSYTCSAQGGQKRASEPLERSHTGHRLMVLNPPWQEHQVLLPAEPFLQPLANALNECPLSCKISTAAKTVICFQEITFR